MRHIRDLIVIHRLPEEFVANFDRRDPRRQEWGEQREQLLRVAARSFVPLLDPPDRLMNLPAWKMIGVNAFFGAATSANLADNARKMGIPVWRSRC